MFTKSMKSSVRRELDAIKRDREYHAKNSHTFDEYEAYEEQYPSIFERWRNAQASFGRGLDKLDALRYSVIYKLQRARRGWSHEDAMDMTMKLPLEIADKLQYFKENTYSVPMDFMPDEAYDEFGDYNYEYSGPVDVKWNAVLEDLSLRFRAYENDLAAFYDTIYPTMEEENEAYRKLHEELEKTFIDFARIFRHLSW